MIKRDIYKKASKSEKILAKIKQERILTKKAGYKRGKYVLWLLADLIHSFEILDIKARVEVTIDNKPIEVFTDIFTPYPNKRVYHASSNGIYGIPLIFDTFEDLSKVTKITVNWNIIEGWSDKDTENNRGSYLKTINIVIEHNVKFTDSKNRFYTLSLLDMVYDTMPETEANETYFDGYETALCYTGLDMNMNTNSEEDARWQHVDGICYNFKKKSRKDKLSQSEQKEFELLKNTCFDNQLLNDFLPYATDQNNIEREVIKYKASVTLTGEWLADIKAQDIIDFGKGIEQYI